jgi:hypothetical protein
MQRAADASALRSAINGIGLMSGSMARRAMAAE